MKLPALASIDDKPLNPATDPRVMAEQLLMRVLPAEMYVSLAATGEARCAINSHEYRFFRQRKTQLSIEYRLFSACIHPSDTSTPDADRLVAEYLLALNDEAEYLRIANLTDITPTPPDLSRFNKIGDTVTLRRPAAYQPDRQLDRHFTGPAYQPAYQPPNRPAPLTLSMIAQAALARFVRLPLRRVPRVVVDTATRVVSGQLLAHQPPTERLQFQAFVRVPNERVAYHQLTFDEFSRGYVEGAVRELADKLGDRDIVEFIELAMDGANDCARVTDPATNTSIRVSRQYDMVTDSQMFAFAVGVVVRSV